MSLINKMLQDLDARGSQGVATVQPEVRPVPPRSPHTAARGLLVGGVIVLAGGAAALGWQHLPSPQVTASSVSMSSAATLTAAPPPSAAAPAGPSALSSRSPSPGKTVTPHAATKDKPARHVSKADEKAQKTAEKTADKKAHKKSDKKAGKAGDKKADKKADRKAPQHAEKSTDKKSVKKEEKKIAAPASHPGGTKSDVSAELNPALRQAVIPAAAGATAALQRRDLTPQQKAENEYRRALTAMQEGRVSEAMTGMEQALVIDPRHEASRQTLVSLLLENQRADDAVRVLQQGLNLDPKQPSLAMLLARLQIERGGPAVETLQRTLPYTRDNGEYRALLAAVLQRSQRHKEAAEQYREALRGAPQNGVWLMGLGISLQADNRKAEALDAFTRAKGSGSLSQELQSFVDRRLQQLGR